MTIKALICYQKQKLSIHSHVFSFLCLLSWQLLTDIEGLGSEERRILVQNREEHRNMQEQERGRKRRMVCTFTHGDLLRRAWCVVESTLFVLLAFRGKRNRTFVLDRWNHMACSLFVDDPQLFERASWVTDLCLVLSHQFAGLFICFSPNMSLLFLLRINLCCCCVLLISCPFFIYLSSS